MGKTSVREQHKIIVVGLPPGSSSADLTKLVKPIGNPLSANMVIDADGRERGFGFVQFADAKTQSAAIAALDKTPLAGRTLNVRAVEERHPSGGAGASGARPARVRASQ
jgi:RNA recognition motif-containing protein